MSNAVGVPRAIGRNNRPLWVGCRPSPVTKAAVQAECRVNGSNQRDTGHWIWSAPPAAMAEKRKVMEHPAFGLCMQGVIGQVKYLISFGTPPTHFQLGLSPETRSQLEGMLFGAAMVEPPPIYIV